MSMQEAGRAGLVEGQQGPVSASAGTRRIDGLQLGRATAVTLVAAAHGVAHHYGHAPGPWRMAGLYGVILFFVISGFIMTYTTGTGRFDPRRFIDRRIRRVVPIYYVSNVVLLAAVLLAPSLFGRTTFDPAHFVTSMLFIPAYDPSGSGAIWPFFKLGWTLNYEMFFYAVFATLFAFTMLVRVSILTVLFVGLVLIGASADFSAAIPRFYTQAIILPFVAGTWLGAIDLRKPIALPPVVAWGLLVCASTPVGMIALGYGGGPDSVPVQLVLSLCCALQIAAVVSLVDGQNRRLPALVLLLGDASYSIYLTHMYAVGAVTAIARRLPAYLLYPSMAAAAVAGIICGIIVYLFVERPLNRLIRDGARPGRWSRPRIGQAVPTADRP